LESIKYATLTVLSKTETSSGTSYRWPTTCHVNTVQPVDCTKQLGR